MEGEQNGRGTGDGGGEGSTLGLLLAEEGVKDGKGFSCQTTSQTRYDDDRNGGELRGGSGQFRYTHTKFMGGERG